MQFKSDVVVTGAKRSKGEIEGKPYDSTKVYVKTGMDTSKGDAVGFAGSEYAWGLSDNFLKIASLKYPFQAQATFEMVTNGKSQKTILIDLQPVPQVKA
ncbi:hypothetical protein ACF3NA_00760 [Alkanindiges sp. WGS2144]|uniref:hypothetical protein n=1 Tax=Alkanindiges sp. WGS2144 TaxID=3366808 RepID=UPI00375384EE